jgi:hypothetical protein
MHSDALFQVKRYSDPTPLSSGEKTQIAIMTTVEKKFAFAYIIGYV